MRTIYTQVTLCRYISVCQSTWQTKHLNDNCQLAYGEKQQNQKENIRYERKKKYLEWWFELKRRETSSMDRSHLSRPPTRHAFATFYRLCRRRRGRCLVVIAKGRVKVFAPLRCAVFHRIHQYLFVVVVTFVLVSGAGCIVSDFHLGLPLPTRSLAYHISRQQYHHGAIGSCQPHNMTPSVSTRPHFHTHL